MYIHMELSRYMILEKTQQTSLHHGRLSSPCLFVWNMLNSCVFVVFYLLSFRVLHVFHMEEAWCIFFLLQHLHSQSKGNEAILKTDFQFHQKTNRCMYDGWMDGWCFMVILEEILFSNVLIGN